MPAQYPSSRFHFFVEWGGARIEFSEATGLTQESQAIDYREGSFPKSLSVRMPRPHKSGNITLKRGTASSDSDLLKWLSAPKSAERRDLVITLLNEKREAVAKWKVRNAFPAKMEGPQLKAAGNEVEIESIEIEHDGLELHS